MNAALDTLLKALERMDAMTIAFCEARGIPTIPTMDYARWPERPLGQRSRLEPVAEKTADPVPVTEVKPAEDVKAEGEPEQPEPEAGRGTAKVEEQPAAAEQVRPAKEGHEEEPQPAEQQDDEADVDEEGKLAEEPKAAAEPPAPEPAAAPASAGRKQEDASKPGGVAAYSHSDTSEHGNRTVEGEGGAKARNGNPSEEARKNRPSGSKADNDSRSEDYDDDENLMGEKDQARLAQVDEKEPQRGKLRPAKRNEQKRKAKQQRGSASRKSGDGVSARSRRKEIRRMVEEQEGKPNKEAPAVRDPKAERKKQRRERKPIQREREPTEFGTRPTKTPVRRGDRRSGLRTVAQRHRGRR